MYHGTGLWLISDNHNFKLDAEVNPQMHNKRKKMEIKNDFK